MKAKRRLTHKQEVFLETYIQCLNGAQAARVAGYSAKASKQAAYQILTNIDFRSALAERLKEMAMSSDEVLARLTAQARGSLSSFFRVTKDGHIEFDFSGPEAAANMHLIRKVHTKRKRLLTGDPKHPDVWEHEWVEVELYDSQAALVQLGKFRRLFVDQETRNELVVVGLDEMLERAYGRNRKGR